jgi:hypothetical protein
MPSCVGPEEYREPLKLLSPKSCGLVSTPGGRAGPTLLVRLTKAPTMKESAWTSGDWIFVKSIMIRHLCNEDPTFKQQHSILEKVKVTILFNQH